jgi:hypothetical protein
MKLIPVIFAVLLASCHADDKGKLLPHTEVVLKPGMSVTATNPNGTVTIKSDGKASRIFSGENWEKKSSLIPRRTRWYGSLGLYDPASSNSPYGRLLVDEGLLFFETESEALRYLYVGSTHYKPVFTNSGLVVGYRVEKIPGGEATRSVKLWQIYINGRKPTKMKGADDTSITLKGGTIPDTASPNEAPIGYEGTLGTQEYQPESNSEQDGAGQPATRPESKSDGSDNPQPESEGRSR